MLLNCDKLEGFLFKKKKNQNKNKNQTNQLNNNNKKHGTINYKL